jgi:hypothetical protein
MWMRSSILTVTAFALVLACGCGGSKKPAQDIEPEVSEESTKASTGEGAGSESSSTTTPSSSNTAATTTGGDGVRKIREQETRSQSKYDKESTDVVLGRAARQAKGNCGAAKDDDGKMTGPWGKMTIKVLLGRNGHTRTVTVPSPYEGKPVGKCIANAFSILQFPPWSGQDTEVDWEVEVSQVK